MEPDQNPVSAVPDRNNLLFQRWSSEINRDMYLQGIRYIRNLKLCRMIVRHKTMDYLDLALVSCIRCQKRDHFKYETIRHLPPAVAEYLIAETEIHKTNKIHELFKAVDKFQEPWVEQCRQRQDWMILYFYGQFLNILFHNFAGLDRPQRRKSIRAFLNLHKVFVLYAFTMPAFQSFIRECISPDPDPELTIELLSNLGNFNLMKQQTFLEIPHEFFEILLCYAKAMGFDFWGLWRGIGEFSAEYNPLVQYITDRNNPFAVILMKHGFPFSCEKKIYKEQWYKSICERLKNISSEPLYTELKEKQNRTRMMLILTTFMAFVDIEEAGHVPADSISTLVCLMRCLPDTFVVPSEMVLELTPIILPTFHKDLRRISYNYSTADIFDESYSIHKPRRLQHHCRCTIRRAIANNLGLPEGINELQLPEGIKDYLSLEC